MVGKAFLIVAAVSVSVAGTAMLLSADNRSSFLWSEGPAVESDKSQALPAQVKNATAKSVPDTTAPAPSVLGVAFASAAEQYGQTVRYPPWSIPLTRAQAEAYIGNHYEPVSLPLEEDGQFTVSLDKYRFTEGDTIVIAASLRGPQVFGTQLSATLEPVGERKTVATTQLQAEDEGYYEGTLVAEHDPGEYRLIVEASVDGQPVRHASSLSIEPFLGELHGLDSTYVSNNNLVIPLKFSPEHDGFYAFSAQLFNGSMPIAQLQAEQRLNTGEQTIEFRAHGTVLVNRSIAGPLQLRHIQIRQLPAKPGDRTHYGFGPDDGYRFSPPDLDDLSDTPAANPESEQRAALLRKLADKF